MNQQALTVCPNCLDFGTVSMLSSKTMQVVISNPIPQVAQEVNSDVIPQKMLWEAATDAPNWLSVEDKDKAYGSLLPGEQKVVAVKVDTSSLKLGQQTAALTFTANGDASSKSVELPVTVNVSPLAAGLSFAFCANSSKTLPVTIINLSDQPLKWQASTDIVGTQWLDIDRLKGTLQRKDVETVYVTAKSGLVVNQDLPAANLIFTDTNSGTRLATLPVQLHISKDYTDNGPKIAVDKLFLYFNFVKDSKLKGQFTGTKPLTITNPIENAGPVKWDVTKKVGWLTVDQSTGILQQGLSQTVNVTVDRSSLRNTDGQHRTDLLVTLTFTDPNKAIYEPTTRFILVKPIIP